MLHMAAEGPAVEQVAGSLEEPAIGQGQAMHNKIGG
jgi:hypothetical protein